LGRIPQHFIDELIARADIVEIIGARVQLKKAGREYKACCPFHDEKTPSFWVSPDKQFYHCFGCGKHGTVLGFLMDHDHMAFPEAVEELATRLGVEVPHEGGGDAGPRRAEDSLYDLTKEVARFYAECLTRDARARDYVARRGLTAETLERFQIGYAPNSWNELLRRFGAAESGRKALSDAGLIVERERGQVQVGERHYDRFRDRIMFPIRDARGRTIAFGGRIIDAGEPKYLNSPETLLFHKGRELYALYETRRARTNLTRLLIVEVTWTRCACIRPASTTRWRRSAPPPLRSTCDACSGWCPPSCLPSTAIAPGARLPGAPCSRRCPRRARAARSASCSCPTGRIRTPLSGRRAASPSRRAWRARCRSRSTWCANWRSTAI